MSVSMSEEELVDRLARVLGLDNEAAVAAAASLVAGRPVPRSVVARRLATLRDYRRRAAALLAGDRGIEQRTPEWYSARRGMVTASELNELLGSTCRERSVRTLADKKLQPRAWRPTTA